MKRIINKKGFGKVEVIAMLALLIGLFAIGMKVVADNSQNYSSFKTAANKFANAVAMYKDQYPTSNDVYYLNNVVKKGFLGEVKNPLNASEECDMYESYVEVPEINNKKVVMVCGNYYLEGTQNSSYNLYEIGKWNEEKLENCNETTNLYNYTNKDGAVMLPEYVSQMAFIGRFYENEGVMLSSIYDVDKMDGYKLLIKDVYREKTFIKELK